MDQHALVSLPLEVRAVLERYHALVDETLPGRIEGLHLVGSVALNDYQAGRSDIDFVAVTRDALADHELDRLEAIHARLRTDIPRPWFDGIYVTSADLERNPIEVTKAPCTHEGRFKRDRGFDANPSVWLTLRTHLLALYGPEAPAVWYDLPAIQQWNIENLNTYWRYRLSHSRQVIHAAALLANGRAMDGAIEWCIPGVARLHYTIRTGGITSKSGACHYALTTFPDRWHAVIREALALRNGSKLQQRSRVARLRDLLGFMQLVIDDASAEHPPGTS